jgi:hypothetical protein
VPVARARPELSLSPDEARALLIATAPGGASEVGLADVATEQVMPREGVAEWVLSLAAGPVTVLTVLVLGYFLLRERRSRRDEQLASVRGWAVPACTALVAALGLGSALPTWTWLALGASFLAWVVREALRRGRAGPSLR